MQKPHSSVIITVGTSPTAATWKKARRGASAEPNILISGTEAAGRAPSPKATSAVLVMSSVFSYTVLLSLTNLRFGLEPVLKFRARLITSLDVEFIRSSLDAFLDREHFAIGPLRVQPLA